MAESGLMGLGLETQVESIAGRYGRGDVNLAELARDADLLIRRARIRLTRFADRPAHSCAVVQGNLEIGGRPLRVQTLLGTGDEAVDVLCRRLRERLGRLGAPDCAYQGMAADLPQAWVRPRGFYAEEAVLPRGRPEIRRRKAVPLRSQTVDQAAFHMDAMDYDCHFFADVDTGEDSMVYRCGPTGYKVVQLSVRNGIPQRRGLRMTVSPLPAPSLTQQQAVRRLRSTGLPFLFFSDAAAAERRGAVLYQRFDGHYGLLTARH